LGFKIFKKKVVFGQGEKGIKNGERGRKVAL